MQGNFYMLPHGLSTGNHAPCKKMFRVSHRARLARDGGSDQFELLGTSCPQTRPNPTLGPSLSRPDAPGCSRLQTGARSTWTSLSAPYAARLPAGTGIFPGVGQILPQHFLVVAILAEFSPAWSSAPQGRLPFSSRAAIGSGRHSLL